MLIPCYDTQQVCVYLQPFSSVLLLDWSTVYTIRVFYLMRSYGGLLEPRGSKLTTLKSTFNAKNYPRRLSWSVSSDFGEVEMCVTAWNRENSLKTPYFEVPIQGRSRSSMLVPLESSSAVLVMIRSKSVSICNRSHARRPNNGTPLWRPRRGISSPSDMKFAHKKLETLRYDAVITRSLYLTWGWIESGSWQTDGRTDRQTELRYLVCA